MWETIIRLRAERVAAARAALQAATDALNTLRANVDGDGPIPSNEDIDAATTARASAEAELSAAVAEHDRIVAERDADAALTASAERIEATPAAARADAAAVTQRGRPAVEITRSEAVFRPDTDPTGAEFLRTAVRAVLQGGDAASTMARSDAAVRDEYRLSGAVSERAIGTGAVSGFAVPAYLTALWAALPRGGDPLLQNATRRPLPSDGMLAYIPRLTTGTSAAIQAAEGDQVSETDADDTLLSVPVRTTAGRQTLSRQAIERAPGALDAVLGDLASAYRASRDATVITASTDGLTNAATNIAYTDATPTVAELYPKLIGALAAVEAALLNQDTGRTIAVMHSRRWYWLQSALVSTWPAIATQGMAPQVLGEADPSASYGSGFRGVLPGGTPVVVDNNLATNLGAGTNEDEIYFLNRDEFHVWEDGDGAPRLLSVEKVDRLQVEYALYGFWAFTVRRQPHVQKVSGTGNVAPSF